MPLDIVYNSLFLWENPYSSISLSFARVLGRQGHRVWYINMPCTWRSLWQRRREPLTRRRLPHLVRGLPVEEPIPHTDPPIRALQPPPVWPINFLPEGRLYEWLRRRNEQRVWRAVRQWLERHGLKRFLYINCYNPYYLGVLPPGSGALVQVYQCIDDMSQEPWTARHGARLEEEVIRKADLVWVSARRLHALKGALNPHTHIIHNAADIDLFARAATEPLPCPAELQGMTGPIIGFTGNLDPHRIDYDLIGKVARAHADKQVVLVGPVNATAEQRALLCRHPNIHLPGPRPIEELPAWLRRFDCALLPFRCNELTASIYPLKINEYLAAGKAVVSTAFSEDIRTFRDVIFLAENDEDFVRKIPLALSARQPEQVARRMEVAKANSWEARMEQFFDLLKAHPKGKLLWNDAK